MITIAEVVGTWGSDSLTLITGGTGCGALGASSGSTGSGMPQPALRPPRKQTNKEIMRAESS